jgi:UDP-3-O-[3-hydroxymyristoyl] glucosamine N-acyltransferase
MTIYRLSDIAAKLDAQLVLKGDDLEVSGLSPIESAESQHITFLSNAKYQKFLDVTKAGAVLITQDLARLCPVSVIVVKDPYIAFAKVAAMFDDSPRASAGIHPTACIDASVKVPDSASIGPFVVVKKGVHLGERVVLGAHSVVSENCVLGEGSELKPHVTLYHHVRMGKNCLIHSGAVLGSDGFGNANENGRWIKVPQLGGVASGDEVEIGANTTIDRGAVTDTKIGNNVRIDNQVQIAHNVIVGDGTAMAAQVGIAGSAEIGRHCLLAGKVGINGHIKITDQVIVLAMSGVSHDLTQKGIYSAAIPAQPVLQWNKTMARLNRLDVLMQKVKHIIKHLGLKEDKHG